MGCDSCAIGRSFLVWVFWNVNDFGRGQFSQRNMYFSVGSERVEIHYCRFSVRIRWLGDNWSSGVSSLALRSELDTKHVGSENSVLKLETITRRGAYRRRCRYNS